MTRMHQIIHAVEAPGTNPKPQTRYWSQEQSKIGEVGGQSPLAQMRYQPDCCRKLVNSGRTLSFAIAVGDAPSNGREAQEKTTIPKATVSREQLHRSIASPTGITAMAPRPRQLQVRQITTSVKERSFTLAGPHASTPALLQSMHEGTLTMWPEAVADQAVPPSGDSGASLYLLRGKKPPRQLQGTTLVGTHEK